MSSGDDEMVFSPAKFCGQARLFPLPNLVLFPHVVQPLHIFERRYVDLFQDAIEGDRLIAMAVLRPGWEQDYEGRPPIEPVACLGRVLTWQAQPGSRYNVLLLGLRRVRVGRELPPDRAFRAAGVDVLSDAYPPAQAARRPALHRKLITAFEKMLPHIKDASEVFNQLSVNSISLGALSDVIGYALDLDLRAKQALLAETNVDRRARMLLSHLQKAARAACLEAVAAGFPPSFSEN
jgi:ATP-dependent Lon protease